MADNCREEHPLVSVLMTSYNREGFISQAIESVLTSTYKNIELIIVDDASKDRTVEIAKSYAAKDARVKVHTNQQNLGDYPNRNKAASKATGKYIVFTDSDDWMFENSLVQWVWLMENRKAVFGIFVSNCFSEPVLFTPEQTIRSHFFKRPLLMHGPGATIVTNTYFKSIGGFPERYGPANDMYYNLKAASQTATLFFPFPLGDYRRHEGQEINNQYSYLYNNYLYLNDALEQLDLPLTTKEKNYLSSKNKRRFVVNCIRYLFVSRHVEKSIEAVRKAQFNLRDFFQALYIKSLKNSQTG